jgi:Ca2+/H+ antiporter
MHNICSSGSQPVIFLIPFLQIISLMISIKKLLITVYLNELIARFYILYITHGLKSSGKKELLLFKVI